MDLIFCLTHQKMEVFVKGETVGATISLNEQVQGPHHYVKNDPLFVHAGPLEECEKCR